MNTPSASSQTEKATLIRGWLCGVAAERDQARVASGYSNLAPSVSRCRKNIG